eukprot:182705-Chlamydomonas_euryale.AAC.15
MDAAQVSSEAEADEKLPPDLRPLYDVGLCSFMSVLISIEHEVAGTLLIAKEAADGFEVDWMRTFQGHQGKRKSHGSCRSPQIEPMIQAP